MNNILVTINSCNEDIKEKTILRFCQDVLKKIGIVNWELSVIFCSSAEIRKLNNDYRKKDYPTDVLSFSQDGFLEKNNDHIYYAGDIAVCYEEVHKNSRNFNVTVNEELKRVIIHGILHLSGCIHKTNDADEEMMKIQESVLNDLKGEKIIEIG